MNKARLPLDASGCGRPADCQTAEGHITLPAVDLVALVSDLDSSGVRQVMIYGTSLFFFRNRHAELCIRLEREFADGCLCASATLEELAKGPCFGKRGAEFLRAAEEWLLNEAYR